MNLEEYRLMQSVEDQHWWYATLHQQVLDAVQEYTNAKPVKILDAGCGTGLCGPLLKPWARRLVGVDLSGGMLEKARALQLYDEHIESLGVDEMKDRSPVMKLLMTLKTLRKS